MLNTILVKEVHCGTQHLSVCVSWGLLHNLINLCQVQLLKSDVKPSQAHYSNARPISPSSSVYCLKL